MKAEERKELETNILADKLGRMVKGAKRGPSRRGIFIVIGIALAAVALLIFTQYRGSEAKANSKRWKDFLLGQTLFPKNSEQDKLARMRVAHQLMWQEGVNKLLLPNQLKTAIASMEDAKSKYLEASKLFKDDPVLGGEANFHLGIIHELLSIDDPANIDNSFKQAVEYYEKAAKHWKPESPLGKMAMDRVSTLQFSVSEETIKGLKRKFDQEKAIAPLPEDQNEFETVVKLLKPLNDKSFDSANALGDAVGAALAKGNQLPDDAQIQWKGKVLSQARDRRDDAKRVYAMIADWARRPPFPPQFNPHMGIPGMQGMGMPPGFDPN